MKRKRNIKKLKENGEAFTPDFLVEEMLGKLPPEVFKDNKTFLDNSAGNGQFLYNVLLRKMANGFSHEESLKSLYGVELDKSNCLECKQRLLLAVKNPSKEAVSIINHQIICADALDPNHSGWDNVGYYWKKV